MSTTSRAMSAIPAEELPILEALISIRNRLTALKKDSSEFIRPQDVQQLYKEVIKQVTRLNTVRDEAIASEVSTSDPPRASTSTSRGGEAGSGGGEVDTAALAATNRVDTTLNDVFSLLSLFFLTIGKSRETPATFSQIGCMKQLLDHLAESGIYTEADLQPFSKRLAELRAIIKKDGDAGKHPVQLTKLMTRKLEACEKVLRTLEGTLSVLSVELVPIHQRLVSVRRQIAAAAAKPKPAKQEIKQLQEELRKIDSKRVDGKFLGPGGSSVPAGQAILVGILEDCFEICHDITVRNDDVPHTLQPIHERLSEICGQLEHLVLTHRWTLRETDLWNYQVTLKEIDRLRVNGKFVDSEGKQPEGQLVLLYLLRRCYGLIYRLVASSEPISEELMPISNKLSTISKCLKEVSKYGGPFTMRDLYPYRLALHQIDGMRSDVKDKEGNETGVKKWLGRDGSVPEGQAILRAQFEEVEQTIEEMLNREEDDDDDDEEGEDEDWEGSAASGEVSDFDDESVASEGHDSGDDRTSRSGPGSTAVFSPYSPSLSDPFNNTAGSLQPHMSPSLSAMAATAQQLAPPLASSSPTTPSTARPAPSAAVAPPSGVLSPPVTLASDRSQGSAEGSGASANLSAAAASGLAAPSSLVDGVPALQPLPPGAAPLAVPGPFAPPPIDEMPILSGLTAREGHPALVNDGLALSASPPEQPASSVDALRAQMKSTNISTPLSSHSSAGPAV
ncbi:hypothetical protein IE81DRAFT_323119 [Ceraceosorus guamensis]|uniref:Uncharacterized protein n=1 Tax=Ceraceosorus guamensis TaxID=1522189 RepID=A0A316W0X7_9BASI|nr:hypothetical protein IE81DRAFT_323119 [Ceraceosorus guamensis]PWN42768.1 hypothetical protein IE81DRAFT_323119 [Ceraceosorus guamensis]